MMLTLELNNALRILSVCDAASYQTIYKHIAQLTEQLAKDKADSGRLDWWFMHSTQDFESRQQLDAAKGQKEEG